MSNNPSKSDEWKALEDHALVTQHAHLNNLFKEDINRFDRFSLSYDGITFDYSKQRVTHDTLKKLCQFAKACGVEEKRDAMFNGQVINVTEKRAVLHTALRRPKTDNVSVNGQNVMPVIHQTLDRMKFFSNQVREGQIKGATGKVIDTIISIGVGGSDLGPRFVCDALRRKNEPVTVHFVANIDGADIKNILSKCDAEKTLFVMTSKSFGTQETLVNAAAAKEWLISSLPKDADITPHLIGVSAEVKAAQAFGIAQENIFPIWDWVNGRFSLWSAIGLPICLQCGFDVFEKLLAGACDIDQHFLTASLDKNIPALMAMIATWNRNFLSLKHYALMPYAQKLNRLPAYIQQLEMESNGKNADLDGHKITDYKTNAIMFGEVGTNGQHSFFQLLHQGSDIMPCDFIGYIEPMSEYAEQHQLLMNNMLAQSESLMTGQRNREERHKNFEGNRPSNTLLFKRLDAFSLGQLIAIYEHKTFMQGIMWNINSFDQFGVELGKNLARQIENQDLSRTSSSLKGLYSLIHKDTK